MTGQNQRRYTSISLSMETYDLLNRLKRQTQEIFKTKISFESLVKWLVTSKVDWADLLASISIDANITEK